MVLRKPEVPCAKPYTECRIHNQLLVLLLHYLPLGKRMEYVRDAQTQRDVRSRLIRSGSLLGDDLRELLRPHSNTVSLFAHFSEKSSIF